MLSNSAAARITKLQEADGTDLMLRLMVLGGGCSGYQYEFSFATEVAEDDLVFENGSTKLIVDEVSHSLLEGAIVEYVDDIMGASFRVRNPNATASCGCGNSFGV